MSYIRVTTTRPPEAATMPTEFSNADQIRKAEASMAEAVARAATGPNLNPPGQPPISDGLTDKEPKKTRTLPSPS